MMQPTARILKALVRIRHEDGELTPLVSDLAKELRVSQKKIVDSAEDAGLNVNTGLGCNGGVGDLPKSEWTLEDLSWHLQQ